VVTAILFKAGKTPVTLQPLLAVSGTRLYAFISPSPLYKNLSTSLSSGTQVANVKALQRALKAGGYYTGSISGTFDSSTASALEEWQDTVGQSATGTLDISKFIWVPSGGVLADWQVSIGENVGSSTQLATLSFPKQIEAQAEVGQSDIGSLKVGQKAELTVDGQTSIITGTILSISDEPSSSTSGTTGGTSSSTVQYTVTVRLSSIPSYVRIGMTGSMVVTIQKHADVVLVPTRAIVGTGSSAYVRVLQNGQTVLRQVSVGMTTTASTEIQSGLAVGETVVTGTVTAGTGNSSQSGGSILNGESGGFPGGGGFPSGGFPPAGGNFGGQRSTQSGGGE
jgi:membrane fusion protein, macrolide-specific efflux system